MYLALFSVVFGSALTFAQAAALFHLLDLETYVAYRAVLNTMNVAAPFLCFGFDNAGPVLRRMTPGFPFFWNLLAAHTAIFVLLVVAAVLLPPASKLQPLMLGLAASITVAAALIVATYHRTEGAIRRYFLSINIVDRSVRTAIILGLAVLIQDVLLWSLLMSALCLAYAGLSAWNTRSRPQFDTAVFVQHLRTSFPYIFSGLGIIVLTRMPFYAAYLVESKLATAKIDIWLLFSLFLLIPMLNKSKIEEAASTGLAREYMTAMKQSWGALRRQEFLVCGGVVAVACGAVLAGLSARADLLAIVLPLMLGMILIASLPNYVQVVCFVGEYALGVKVSVLIAVIAMLAYLPRLAGPALPIPLLFVMSAALYCVIGCGVARLLAVRVADFWRWRDALLLGASSATALAGADLLLS